MALRLELAERTVAARGNESVNSVLKPRIGAKHSIAVERLFSLVFLLVTAGCGSAASSGGGGAAGSAGSPSGATSPETSVASYEVPVPDALSAAATYPISWLTWQVSGSGAAELSYALPLGLVGREIRISLTGVLDPATQTAELSGDQGTAVCTLSSVQLVCTEHLSGLLPITPDLSVVAATATADFGGAAADRVAVARIFADDPIGILRANPKSNGGDDAAGAKHEPKSSDTQN